MDIAHGLVGKTAIHPDQISVIEEALKVSHGEHSDALRILNSTQAVFKSQGQCVNRLPIAGGLRDHRKGTGIRSDYRAKSGRNQAYSSF